MIPIRRPWAQPGVRRRRTGLLVAVLVGLWTLAGLTVPGVSAAAPEEPPDDLVRIVLDAQTPRVVTADGPAELVLTGRVDNGSALPVRDLEVRLSRGGAVEGGRDTLAAIDGTGAAPSVPGPSVDLPGVLEPGANAPFSLRVPLTALQVDAPGVYPVVLDAEGVQGSSGARSLDAVRSLLPVAGVPGQGPVVAPAVGQAAGVSVLYPIADRPRRLAVVPGAPALLTDDDLATSFAPGGRLAGLVDALGSGAPLGSPAARSLCLAVDADLLETAQVMAGGYQVRTPDGGTTAGRGADAAGRWLANLRTQAQGRCVVALPYAEADLVATARANLTDLTAAATSLGTRQVGDLLGLTPLPDTVWPAGGAVDERTLADVTTAGTRALILDGDTLEGGVPTGGVARLPDPPGSAPSVVALDPVAAASLAPRSDGVSSRSAAGTDQTWGAQDALGVVAEGALADTPRGTAPPTTVVAPPTDWSANGAEAAAFLDGIGDLARLGLLRPVDVGTLLGQARSDPATPTTALATPTDVGGIEESVVARAGVVRDRQRDLLAATERDGVGTPSPADFVEPLTEGVLRALSADRRGNPQAQDAAVSGVEAQTDELRSLVRVAQPSGSYSLGSNDAPLLLTVENRLPVAVRTQVVLEPTAGLRTGPLPIVTVPAFGSRQLQVEVEVVRSGQFSVDAQARTPGGEPLGPSARLLLRSTAYGTITVWLTASAFVVLVILASVRIARRIRAARRERRSHRTHRRSPNPPTGPPTPSVSSVPTSPITPHPGTPRGDPESSAPELQNR